jgi:Zn-finger nucleic acid-binding protein
MTIEAVGRFRRVSKDLEAVCVDFVEDLKAVWDDPGEVSRILTETREALGAIYGTLEVLEKGITRIEQLQVRDRRKHLKMVKRGTK